MGGVQNLLGAGSYTKTKHNPVTTGVGRGKDKELSPTQDQPQTQDEFGCTGKSRKTCVPNPQGAGP